MLPEPVLQESHHSAEAETVQAAAEQPTAESREHGPNDWAGYRSAAAALREQKSMGDAEALLLQAAERFPNESDVFRDLATLSQQRRDWQAAEQWWQKCLALVPDAPYACTGLAVALRQQGRVAEAEALLVATQERLPGHPAAFEEYARVADANKDWTEAQRRWSALRERFPNHLGGYRGLATVLGEQGLFDDAEALLLQAAERWPDHRGVYQDLARLAERRKDWAAAEKWGQKFLALTPDLWWAYTGLAATLRQQGRIAEAESVLVAGQDRLPGEPSVFEQYARLAETSKDWQEAQRRWAAFRERFPLHWSGYYGGAAALREQGLLDDAAALLLQAAELLPNEISTGSRTGTLGRATSRLACGRTVVAAVPRDDRRSRIGLCADSGDAAPAGADSGCRGRSARGDGSVAERAVDPGGVRPPGGSGQGLGGSATALDGVSRAIPQSFRRLSRQRFGAA